MSNRPQTHVRLVDIATKLGVAKITVSKALRDHPDLAPDTTALIKKTAAEMGYVPNYFAKSLQSRAGSGMLGVIVPKIRHAFFAEVIASIQQAAAEHNYEILLAVSLEDAAAEQRHIQTFLSMRADGLLLSVTQTVGAANLDLYDQVVRIGVPLVMFDRAPASGDYSAVLMDDIQGGRDAMASAVSQGWRRIAHLGGYGDTTIGRDRRLGYEQGLAEIGLEARDEWVIQTGLGEADGYQAFQRLWACEQRPDAIYCASFPQAVGVMDAMRAHAPEAVGKVMLMFFGVREMARFFPHPNICIVQPAEAMGREAVDGVMTALSGARAKPLRLALPTSLMTSSDAYTPDYLRHMPLP